MIVDVINRVIVNFFGLHGQLFPFERQLIERVAEVLSQEAKLKLLSQLMQSNSVYRDIHGKSVLLRRSYWLKRNAQYESDSLFDVKRPPFRMAKANLRASRNSKSIKAVLWIVSGHLFEISYSMSPTRYFETRNLAHVKCDVENITILNDPSINPFENEKKRPLKDSCQKDVDILLGVDGSSEFQEPYSADFISKIAADYVDFLPLPYFELLSHSNGCKVGKVKIYGIEEINPVVLEDAAFLVFAEMDGEGVLATKDGNRSKQIWFLNYIDETRDNLGASFSAALLAKL
jgi:hypothetical protein